MVGRRYLLEQARGGDARKQFEAAESYDFERPKNRRRAAHWYRKAAEQGHVEAQNQLAELLRDVMNDRREAAVWFRQAAEQGDTEAQVSLGYALFYAD